MKCIIGLGFLWLGVPLSSEAGRTVRLYPFDTPGGWSVDQGPCWSGFNRKIDFVNLSDLPQTLEVTLSNIRLQFGACTPPLSGNWIKDPVSPTCYNTQHITVRDQKQSITLAPKGSNSVSFLVMCRMQGSGVTDCASPPDVTTASLVPMAGPTTIGMAEATIEVSVAEDRGAILGNVVGRPAVYCVDLKSTTHFNVPLNGGRPF
jgi:hypothetical protein